MVVYKNIIMILRILTFYFLTLLAFPIIAPIEPSLLHFTNLSSGQCPLKKNIKLIKSFLKTKFQK